MNSAPQGREAWGSRIGLILAAAGNAIGIGNLLRFPGQAGQNGGGAFLIPYLLCLVLLGLPMMWVAWTIGRHGGKFGHGTTPGMFDRMWRSPAAKYVGAVGIALPMIFVLYYTYIEAWCLAYAWFSFKGDFVGSAERTVDLRNYLLEFQGDAPTANYFPGLGTAFTFLAITIAVNVVVLWRGVSRGIEALAKVAIPLLFLFCVILAVRVFTLPEGTGRGTVGEGLAFLWTPDFSKLGDFGVWLAAAGQIFFTLSIGFGSIECYASYVREEDDIALTGLTTAATNEFVEIVFGSAIAIPAAAAFFGAESIADIAGSGSFNIGMVSMPEILRAYPGLKFFGTIWFLLLFFAAFTSSVAVAQPVMAFLQDEAKWKRSSAAIAVGLLWILGSSFVAFGLRHGAFDEMDFWAGQMGLVIFSLLEVCIFIFAFKMGRGWEELHRGADIRVPRFFYGVVKYVTPVLLLAILGGWTYVDAYKGQKLDPQPRIKYGVVGEEKLPGLFEFGRPVGTGEQKGEAKAVEDGIKGAVRGAKRDLEARITLRVDGSGEIAVDRVLGNEELLAVLDPMRASRWLRSAVGLSYEIQHRPAATPAPIEFVVAARYTAPMIWITRGLMAAFLVGTMIFIGVLWGRRSGAADSGH